MPQVEWDDIPHFLGSLKGKGIRVRENARKRVGELHATQREMFAPHVSKLAKSNSSDLRQPILVSSDDYILDGHHRWAALLTQDPTQSMKVHQIGLPIRKLLDVAGKYDRVGHQEMGEVLPVTASNVAARFLCAEGADCWSDYNAGGLSWEGLQDCLKRFEEDDYDDYSYRRSRPPEPTDKILKFRSYSPEYNEWKIRLDRAFMGGMAAGDRRSPAITKLLWGTIGMGSDPGDVEKFKAFEKKHRRLISQMPKKPALHNVGGFPISIRIDALSSRERKNLEKFFTIESPNESWAKDWFLLKEKR